MVIYYSIKKTLNNIKRKYFTWIVSRKAASYGENLIVNFRSSVTTNTDLGNNVNFNGFFVSGRGSVHIGNNFHSGRRCRVMTDYHNYDNGKTIPYDETYIIKNVIIKDNVWFGNDITILPGVTVGEGAIIQAGSVVVKDVPDLAIIGGHPAQIFKYRNKEHYYKLKKEKAFY